MLPALLPGHGPAALGQERERAVLVQLALPHPTSAELTFMLLSAACPCLL